MDVVFVLLPLMLVLAGIGVAAFIWAVRSGQFEDLETPAVRLLFDDDDGAEPAERNGTADGPQNGPQNGTSAAEAEEGPAMTERDGAR